MRVGKGAQDDPGGFKHPASGGIFGMSSHLNYSCSHPAENQLFVRGCMGTNQLGTNQSAPASLVRSPWRA